ncbi:MAG: hypothetical protein AB7Y46_16875, partial [Armatimonadota bacterium]
ILDLIEDGVSGSFVERDPGAIALALDRLAAAPELLENMRREVHVRSLRFSWERQAEQIEELFVHLAPGPGEEAVRA